MNDVAVLVQDQRLVGATARVLGEGDRPAVVGSPELSLGLEEVGTGADVVIAVDGATCLRCPIRGAQGLLGLADPDPRDDGTAADQGGRERDREDDASPCS